MLDVGQIEYAIAAKRKQVKVKNSNRQAKWTSSCKLKNGLSKNIEYGKR